MESKTILVVEDDFDIREIICALLNEEGHTAVGAGNGKIALDYLATSSKMPDLVLLDLMMPVMSGYELIDEMKTAGFDIPIVVLSAVSESAKVLGVKAHISKPFEFSSLLRTIIAHSA